MERLTNKAWRNFDPWECCGQDKYCQRGCHDPGGCVKGCIVPRLYARLGAYEGTGLTPEEVNKVRADIEAGYMKSIARACGIDVERLKELARADREGCVVVLPVVPVGRPGSSKLLYVIEDGEIYEDELCSATVGVGPSGGVDVLYETFSEQLCFYQTDIGKTVFLTREEAEEALRRAENG